MAGFLALAGGPIAAQSTPGSAPIASGALRIQGSSLTLYADAVTTDADQTVNVGERARVRTCFGGVDAPCGGVLPGDPRISGLVVRAELGGPEVPQPIALETVPGGSFVLPGFQQQGDYRLENIRLVDDARGVVLANAEPSLAILHVREILLASATVRALSLEELRQRGITFTAENFQAFDFAVGFAFGGEIVEIKLPMVYSGYGTVQPLAKPTVSLDGLPADVAHAVERWQPPQIVPFKLEAVEDPEHLRADLEEDEALNLPLFGAIVLPGNVSYLNQFFEAKLVVANGAPVGSNARLDNLAGLLRLPPYNALRVGATDPAVAPGSAVPVLDAGGGRFLSPGEQGTAAWTVEGLLAGSHTVQIDITGDLVRPGREPFPVLSRIQAAVEVVDARFNLTFSHPDVVREGEGYSLYVTVTNLSAATQNLISVDLDEQHLSGTHRADPNDNLRRTIQSLSPGQAETLEFRLVSDLDGRVVATTFQSTSASGQGTIRLRTGVGELGIPLSPATLILPRFTERLKTPFLASDELHRAHTRFLGLAHSLAVAPAALTPGGLPRVITTDVERRAVDFAQAGMRTYLHEPLLESLEVLALDYLGNRAPLVEIDELRRSTTKGAAVGVELARVLRAEQGSRGLDAEELFDHLAETTTYASPYVAALLVPAAGSEALQLEVQGAFDGISGTLKGFAGETGALRGLPFGELLPVLRSTGQTATVPLALVGHVSLDEQLQVVVRNPSGQTLHARLLVVVPGADGRDDRRLEVSDLTVAAGGAAILRIGAAVASPGFVDAAGAPLQASLSTSTVQRPPFRLIGAVQDFRMSEEGPDSLGNMHRPNRYGNGVLYLFNRPPERDGAEDGANYRIRSTFHGLDAAGLAASGTSDKLGTGAWVQDDGRTVAVRFATPLSALVDPATGEALLAHEHLLDRGGLLDAWGESLSADVPAPTIETSPLHVGGLVTGKVVRGTGEPVAGAKVQLIRSLLWETRQDTVVKLDYLGEVVTGSDGTFFFDFVENPHWDRQVLPGFTLRAIIPAGADPALQPEETQEVSSVIRLQNRAARINIALLGRGTVRGLVVYGDTREPVRAGTVNAASTLFNEQKSVALAADGTFTVPGVPVGPITLVARDRDGHVGYATVGVDRPGAVTDALVEVPRFVPGKGTVAGVVIGATTGEVLAGSRVSVYSHGAALEEQVTDGLGRFRFDDVPEGQVSLQAANWAISRVSVFTDLTLAAGETQEVTLRLPQGASRTITGTVYFFDPITNSNVPVQGAVAFIEGPGMFGYTDAFGRYRIEGVPVQGATERYSVKAIDFARRLQGAVSLPPILDVSPDVVEAQAIVLQQMTGGIDGVVLDPLGRPLGGAEVVVFPYGTTTSAADGSFAFENLPVKGHTVIAHVGDGLQAGRVGYFGQAGASIVYGGHRPFVSVRMQGAGVVTVLTRTSTSTGVLTPIYYKPTYYSAVEYAVRLKGSYVETSTDQNGRLQLVLPVGPYELVAYNPFHGMHTIGGLLTYAGQLVDHEIVFEDAATVAGQVVGVDGRTPVPDVEVVLEANGLLGQKQRTDADGRFRYDLVPKGRVLVTARGVAGNVERLGRTLGYVGTAGQTLDLIVQMKAQGTVSGQVVDVFNGTVRPLSHAQYYVQEDSFPFRRLPAEGNWFVTDASGNYQVAHVYAGGVTVVARDSGQVSRQGLVRGELAVDWQVLQLPRIEMVTNVGALQITVRNPVTGGAVADAQVRLSNNEATVTSADGVAFFDALPLGTYSVYCFYAPNGQSGRLSSVQLTSAGQQINRTVYLDQRGEVRGTLWDDVLKTRPMGGGTVRLEGQTAGGRVTALATTSSAAGALGTFEFLGIPEGTFTLEAALPTSPRRAAATAAITATSPIAVIDMVLEPVGDAYFRLFEKLRAGVSPVSLSGGLFSLRLRQSGYDYAQLAPAPGGDRFLFPNVLKARGGSIAAEELTAERRTAGASFPNFTGPAPVPGVGSQADPYQLLLSPKGVVRVWVRDPNGATVAGANVTLNTAAGPFPSVSGPDGSVVFSAVPAGAISASVSSLASGTGGYATSTLTYDDDVIEITVALAPAVRAHGTVYQPVPDDRWNGDPSILVPAPGIIVEIRDSRNRNQLVLTDDQGVYRFTALATGAYALSARNNNGDQLATAAGVLVGPDGNDNLIPSMILDAGPPRLLSIAPPPGIEGVSRTAVVELVFSEQLDPNVLPVNRPNPYPYFSLRSATGAWAPGTWTSLLDAERHQVVRFTPSVQYENFTVYSITVLGGPGGVRDRIGRPLTAAGNVGSNFKTADGVGPSVLRSEPDLGRPVDPRVTIRFDFSEAVSATDEQLDGDFSGDAVELYWQRSVGSALEWQRLPVVTYLTRSNFSLAVQPVEGVNLQGDTLRRRIVLTGLKDAYGNVMPTYERTFRIYDGQAPVIDTVPFPPGSTNGQLLQGNRYVLTPALSRLDDVTPAAPGGDVDRVEYYFTDPTDPQHPVSPSYSATTYPYLYSFVAAYAGNNVDPRPFPIWVRAVDTSTNASNVVRVAMVVLPNTDPSVEVVQVAASAPVPGVPYAGSKLTATVSGFSDLDGSQLTLFIELWKEGASGPFATAPARLVQRPANGWNDAPSQAATFDLPLDLAEGTGLYVRARVLDANGAVGIRESPHFAVVDDATPPVIDDFSVRLAGAPVTHLFIGEEFYLELRARDGETAVKTVAVELDRVDLFPGTLTATRVTGTTDLYRTATMVVPAGMHAPIPIHAKVVLADWGGNGVDQTLELHIGPERDPAAPQARWKAPWSGSLWPADYTSVMSPQGAALLLRLYARDTNLDVDGNSVPGRLVSVEVRGPVRNAATGVLELAAGWTTAQKVPGTEDIAGAIYEGTWRVPNAIAAGSDVPFETRLVDSAGTETITRVTMTAVAPRQVYEAAITSIGVNDPMLRDGWNADGPVFLLDGTTLSVIPRTDGGVRSLPALFLYTGASTDSGSLQARPAVLTAPEITTYDSAILFQPLELTVEHEVGVGVLSRIDMSKRGLLGSTSTRSMVLPGETGAQPRAGGSHGGSGWFGSAAGGWNRTDLTQPGSPFDSLRNPHLPGGGGASPDASAGGAGGGVIRLLAPAARVRVDGDLVADGGNGTGGSSGGGAGGAIRVTAARLEGSGRITARGGAGTFFNNTGGGGGGRIALSYQTLGTAFDTATQLDASGGINDAAMPSRSDRRGGAGTVYLEVVDPQTGTAAPGRLLLANPIEPARAALTPLPALGDGAVWAVDPATGVVVLDVQRVRGELVGDQLLLVKTDGSSLGSFTIVGQRRVVDAAASGGFRVELHVAATAVELGPAADERALGHAVAFRGASRLQGIDAEAAVRLVADDDLRLGPNGGGALNDRAFVTLRRGSRGLLRGEAPVVTLTTQPAPASVLLGSAITVSWSVSDPLGLVETRQESTFAPTLQVQPLWEEPVTASSTAASTLQVPITNAPASVTYTVQATDEAGRVTRKPAVWPVLANEVPAGAVTLAAGTATPLKAGYPFTAVVHATDRERLSKVTLQASGPVTPATQATTVTGTVADLTYTLNVPSSADGSQPVTLQALLEDASGGATTIAALVVPVAANGAPTGIVTVAAGAPSPIVPGQSTTISVHAEDSDGLTRIDLHVVAASAVTQPEQTKTVTGTSADVTFPLTATTSATPQTLSLTATITDKFGSSSTTAPFSLVISANGAPVGTVTLAAGAPGRITKGQSTTVLVHAEDADGLDKIDLHVTAASAVTQPEQTRTVTGTSVDSTFTLTAAAAATPQTVTVTATIKDRFGNSSNTAPFTFAIVNDVTKPVATLTLNPDRGANGVYRSGESIGITASATDNVGVTGLQVLVGGTAIASSAGATITTSWTVPSVSAPTPATIEVVATDADSNEGRASRTVTTDAVPQDQLPVVAFDCPSTGALLPDDYAVKLTASATDDGGLTKMRFFLEDATTPFAEVTPTGTPAPKQATASATFNLATVTATAVRFRVEALDTAGQMQSSVVSVQRVHVTDLKADGQGTNNWAALATQVVALRSGTLTIDQAVTVAGLLVLEGAKVTHTATVASASPKTLALTVDGPTYVGCGGVIDVSGRGYPVQVTHAGVALQGNDSSGSHMGEGGVFGSAAPGETYGSVYTPQENGAGGYFDVGSNGGGAVRITADRVQIDGVIRANGASTCRSAAGGSVWVKAGVLSGVGSIEAKGGSTTCTGRSGGGGAIAVEYTTLEAASTLPDHLSSQGGSLGATGGAGTVHVRGGSQSYGRLIVDNGTVTGNKRTVLPSLGKGTAGSGSGGATLATGRSKAIAPYFVGHWVEIRSASGVLEGAWRIASIGVDGKTVVLAANGAETITVDEGDSWQGVYRFDEYTAKGQVQVISADPIRVYSEQVITGTVETDAIYASKLVIKPGATLTQHVTASNASPEGLRIEVGELVVESGGVIDVSGRGYPVQVTYAGVALQGNDSSGSHMGEGGVFGSAAPGETYGSVYTPQENGAGGYFDSGSNGGGAVRITADRVQIDGVIRANGASTCRSAAGGSVWVKAGVLSGVGSIEAKGGSTSCGGRSGGGGAIAVEYTTLEAASTLPDHLSSQGGSLGATGGAGTVHVRGGSQSYGRLIVDNGTVTGNKRTVLPSLGKGTAGSGSGGATLATGRSKAIAPYFVGHWVEIRSASGVLEGAWRIASIGVDGKTVVLAANGAETITVDAGDSWQGVYRFDEYTAKGQVQVISADPIRVYSEQVITGTVETDAIYASKLVIKAGATLTQHVTASNATPESLRIEVGELVVESGGVIDVSGRGYPVQVTYAGVALQGNDSSGSHMGEGGVFGSAVPGETYGSVYTPQENGAGGYFDSGSNGGGAVRITADRVQIDGVIRANGASTCRSAAGGSVWVKAGVLSGVGSIEAKGGSTNCGGRSGGGGAIAVEYTTLEAASTLPDHLSSQGGSLGATGGAGTVHVLGGSQSYGRLIVDNGTVTGNKRTVLPSLGKGTAGSGSGGATLATGRSKAIAPYFVGHWVEIRGAAGVLEGTWRIASIGVDGKTVVLAANGAETIAVDEGDSWQGVYRFDEYTAKGQVQVISADPIRVYSEQVITGTVETDAIYASKLVIKPGATLTQHVTASNALPEGLRIEVGELVVESGGVIDVSGRGYPVQVTYAGVALQGNDSSGSHMGEGGVFGSAAPGETYGSVYTPQENGAGGYFDSGSNGGGAVRITADRVQIDGVIRANGAPTCRSAAGGSVWVKAGVLSGVGSIEAKGGSTSCGGRSGGGGAIAVDYTTLEAASTLPDHLSSQGGSLGATGGAGTVHVRGGSQSYGRLIVDNGTVTGNKRTVLPSLGKGTAVSGSGGATLVTGRSKAIAPYFVGHWVEIRGAAGVLEGTWRIASIGVDGKTVTLAANASEAATVDEGDSWQGVYRFDEYTVRGQVQVISADPIKVYSEQVITGTVETDAIYASKLVIKPGATLTQHVTASNASPEGLRIEVGELVVESGGVIDVSGRGYPVQVTYAGVTLQGNDSSGSHMGEGGVFGSAVPGETYGSVYTPQENGAGGYFDSGSNGGGAVRITADRVQIDGVIRANGASTCRSAAGGSVWVKAGVLSGVGSIEAKGGSTSCGGRSGGGGAIAVEYTTLEAASTLPDHLSSQGGSLGVTGGAGTVHVRGGSQSHGRLIVDNGTVTGNKRTVLPSLGKGTAVSGSGGATLATGRSKAIAPYFVGHWVEIRGAAGVLEGTWRIASIGVDGKTVTLASNAGEAATVDEGDSWQGVYRFDEYTAKGQVQVISADPIRVYSEQVITGTVETDAIYASKLVVKPGATLTQHVTASNASPEGLRIEVGELVVESGGVIDVSGRGYPVQVTYPGTALQGNDSSGSHMGEGGLFGSAAPGETYGSVYTPQENGAGGYFDGGSNGGGAVRITADRVQIDGVIQANGASTCRSAAGGSVWVKAGVLSGVGSIEAKGGSTTCGGRSGGGGAIALEYTALEAASTLLDHLNGQGGSLGVTGGAGTVYVHPITSPLGSIRVDNGAIATGRRTVLPPLGRGIVQAGSSSGTVLTGRDATIPAYFVGHYLEVEGQDRFVKGVWRISTVDGTTVTLEPNPNRPFTIAPGDRWRGIYRFDAVTVASGSVLVSLDRIVQLVPPLPDASVAGGFDKADDDGSETIYGNDESPRWVKSAISIAVGSVPGSYRVALAPNAVSDPDGIGEVRLTSGGRSVSAGWSPTAGASFLWPGFPGQRLQLVALDAHSRVQRAGWLELPLLPDGGWAPQLQLGAGVTPRAVAGNDRWLGIGDEGIQLYASTGTQPVVSLPPHAAGEEVVDLAADGERFLVATASRIDLLDLVTPAVTELPLAFGRVLDVAAGPVGSGEAVVLLADDSDPEQPAVRLAQLLVPSGAAPSLSTPSELALPRQASAQLQRTPGFVHLFGLASDGSGIIYSWPASAPGEPLTAEPTVAELASGWRGVGPWERGAVLLAPTAVRLLEHTGGGWQELSRIELGVEPIAAAAAGSQLVVLVPGEVLVYDLADAAAPVLAGRHPGSSYRAVEPLPDGEVLLWSPPLAAPPLRWNPLTAVPGEGFVTVVDGLP